jgi:predicted ATPase with chaperone activity
LAPADLEKDAGGFDLPIALGLLLGNGQGAFDRLGSSALVGELALTGETRPIKGALALQAAAEQRDGLLVPAANGSKADPLAAHDRVLGLPEYQRKVGRAMVNKRIPLVMFMEKIRLIF